MSLKTLYKFIFHSAPHPPLAFPPVIPCQSRAWVGVFYSILGLFYSILVSCSALLSLSLMKIFGRFGVGEGWQDKKSWRCFGNNFTVTLFIPQWLCLPPPKFPPLLLEINSIRPLFHKSALKTHLVVFGVAETVPACHTREIIPGALTRASPKLDLLPEKIIISCYPRNWNEGGMKRSEQHF